VPSKSLFKKGETKRVRKDLVKYLNELELVPGHGGNYILCNVFLTSNIVLVDLRSGEVVREYDFQELKQTQQEFVNEQKAFYVDKIGKEKAKNVYGNHLQSKKRKEFRDFRGKSELFDEEKYLDFATYDWGNNLMNGIAYSPADDSFLLSGKQWHFIFKVRLSYREDIERYEASKAEGARGGAIKDDL